MAQNTNEAADEPSSASPHPAKMNLAIALERMDGDAELLREIIDIFLEDHVDGMRELHAAALARDMNRLQRVAHTLKGAAGNFVAANASNLAFQLEQTCKAGDLAGGLALVEPLDQEMRGLAAALRAHRQEEAA